MFFPRLNLRSGAGTVGMLLFIGMAGMHCFESFDGIGFEGHCRSDDDLRRSSWLFEGATCVDGRAQCTNGKPFCWNIREIGGQDEVIATCFGPCIECPDFKGACIVRDPVTRKLEHICVHKDSECWDLGYYIPMDSIQKGCPELRPDCL